MVLVSIFNKMLNKETVGANESNTAFFSLFLENPFMSGVFIGYKTITGLNNAIKHLLIWLTEEPNFNFVEAEKGRIKNILDRIEDASIVTDLYELKQLNGVEDKIDEGD